MRIGARTGASSPSSALATSGERSREPGCALGTRFGSQRATRARKTSQISFHSDGRPRNVVRDKKCDGASKVLRRSPASACLGTRTALPAVRHRGLVRCACRSPRKRAFRIPRISLFDTWLDSLIGPDRGSHRLGQRVRFARPPEENHRVRVRGRSAPPKREPRL